MPLVLHSSVTLAWCFRDEQSEYAEGILRRLSHDVARAPGLWVLEVANGLLVGQRRSRINDAEMTRVREILADVPVTLYEPTLDEAIRSLFELASNQALSVYDATYLQLAMTEGLPLATQDADLRAAAGRVGVPLVD